MSIITVNGIDYKVETDHINVALSQVGSDTILIEATFDHDCEQVIVNVFCEDECESVDYFEFINRTDELVIWMANRLFA